MVKGHNPKHCNKNEDKCLNVSKSKDKFWSVDKGQSALLNDALF